MRKGTKYILSLLLCTVAAVHLAADFRIKGRAQDNTAPVVENAKANQEEEAKRISEETKVKYEKEAELQKQKSLEAERQKQEEAKRLQEEASLAAAKKQQSGSGEVTAKPEAAEDLKADGLIGLNISLKEKIEKYFSGKINKVGMVYFDLTTGEKIAINEDKLFLAASTVKVQMNMIAYSWVKEGKLSLEETIAYSEGYYEGGTGILQNMNKSKPFPVQTLLDYSIIHSDNIATNMMLKRLGGSKNVRTLANQLAGTNVDITKNYVTAEEEFRILKKLYDGREDKNYAHLIEVMKKTTFHDRIDKYVPQSICAHKIGNYGSYVNDVAIVFAEKPYILVVYSEGLSNAAERIAQLSKLVYQEQLRK